MHVCVSESVILLQCVLTQRPELQVTPGVPERLTSC